MQRGRVKWFNENKGYGFIEPEAGGPDQFLHISVWQQSGFANPPQEGEAVLFDTGMDRKRNKEQVTQVAPA